MSYKKLHYAELHHVEHPKPRLIGYVFQAFSDGIQTWFLRGTGYHLERYVGCDTKVAKKRRKWCLVDRDTYDEYGLCPPIVAGPFENLKVAMVALELMGGKR